MQCPSCNVTLMMTDRQGIEIDYCPKCRGVWLDRGELDKIIERASPEPTATHARPAPYRQESHGYEGKHKYRKKKSLLDDLFDF